MSKDEKIAALNRIIVDLLNYILKLERELQTGEIQDDKRHNPSGNQREEIPAG